MDNPFSSIKRPAQAWTIDRFEESWAVLENSDSHEIISLPIATLPEGAHPGTTLVKHGTKWYINEAETSARAARINERFMRIKAKNK